MKRALLGIGIPKDSIIVEARARHSTTNLRNAGRYMLSHGLVRGLVTPPGGGIGGSRVFDQTFYSPTRRCRRSTAAASASSATASAI